MNRDPDAASEEALMSEVDQHPDVHRATEPDEDEVLRGLYGEPGPDGVFRGEGV